MFRGQSLGFFQTLFSQNKLFHEVHLEKTSKLNRFLFYSHKISHNGGTISTDLNRCRRICQLLLNFCFMDRFVRFSAQTLTISRTDDKGRLTQANKNRRHGISIHTLLKLVRRQQKVKFE